MRAISVDASKWLEIKESAESVMDLVDSYKNTIRHLDAWPDDKTIPYVDLCLNNRARYMDLLSSVERLVAQRDYLLAAVKRDRSQAVSQ